MKRYACVLLAYVMLLVSCADAAPDNTPVPGDTPAAAVPSVETETASEEIDWGETEVVMVVEPEPPAPSEYIGQIECPVHSIDYHSYPYVFIEYVGSEAFNEWLQNREKRYEDCAFNDGFPYFIKDFGITEETYNHLHEDTMSYYAYDHPAELIFHGTEEEIEAWYRDLEGHRIRMAKKQYIQELKGAFARRAEREIENLRTATFEELYRAASLTEDDLSEILRGIHSTKQNFPIHINKDLIFTAASEFDIFAEGPPEMAPEAPSEEIDWGETEYEVVIEPVG